MLINGAMNACETAIIESKSYTVRARLNDRETVYAAKDILTACGIKYPVKWLSRKISEGQQLDGLEKLPYPFMTKSGPRLIPMYFLNADAARKVVAVTPCTGDTKKWLLKDVLTYEIEVPEKEADAPAPAAEPQEVAVQTPAPDYDIVLNQRIDKILIELLEIKKYVAGRAAASI